MAANPWEVVGESPLGQTEASDWEVVNESPFETQTETPAEQQSLGQVAKDSLSRGWRSLQQVVPALSAVNRQSALQQLDAIDRGESLDADQLGVVGEQYQRMSPEHRRQFRQSMNVDEGLPKAIGSNVARVAELEQEKRQFPAPASVQRVMESKDFGEAISRFSESPMEFLASVGPESIVQSIPGLAAAAVSGPAGGIVAMGANSFATDLANSVLGELQERGVDTADRGALERALRDPQLINTAVDKATKHAAVVGAFDAASGGVASKTLLPAKTLAGRPLAREAANEAVQMPVQGAIGAAGETGGTLAAGDEIKPGEVLAEAVGEFAGAPAEVASMTVDHVRNRGVTPAPASPGPADIQAPTDEDLQATADRFSPAAPELQQQPALPAPRQQRADFDVSAAGYAAPGGQSQALLPEGEDGTTDALRVDSEGAASPETHVQRSDTEQAVQQWRESGMHEVAGANRRGQVQPPEGLARLQTTQNVFTMPDGRTGEARPLTEREFEEFIRPVLADDGPKSFDEYVERYPHATHVRLVRGSRGLYLDQVGDAGHVLPRKDDANLDSAQRGETPIQESRDTADNTSGRDRNSVDATTDALLTAISKLGGLAKDEAVSRGVEQKDLQHRGHGVSLTFRRSGRTYGEMAQALREFGYPVSDEFSLQSLIHSELNPSAVGASASTLPALSEVPNEAQQQRSGQQQVEAAPVEIPSAQRAEEGKKDRADTETDDGIAVPQDSDETLELTDDIGAQAAIDAAAHAAATSPTNELAQPTGAQKEAENYKVGDPIKLHGYTIRVENPKGTIRSNLDVDRLKALHKAVIDKRAKEILGKALEHAQDGEFDQAITLITKASDHLFRQYPALSDAAIDTASKAWANRMPAHYGRILRTMAPDGDHIDVFLGPKSADEALPVFVYDTNKPGTDELDEYKVMLGYDSEREAREAFDSAYDKGFAAKITRSVSEMTPEVFREWLDSGKHKGAAADWLAKRKPAEKSRKAKEVRNPTSTPAPGSAAQAESIDDELKMVRSQLAVESSRAVAFGQAFGSEQTKRLRGRIAELEAEKASLRESKPRASANKVFTEDAAAAARERLRKKLGQINSGLDPEMIQDGITLAGYHIEKGARTFAAYSKAMMADLGEAVRPYLKSWYMAVRFDPRAFGFVKDMDSVAAVEAANVDAEEQRLPAKMPINDDVAIDVFAKRLERDGIKNLAEARGIYSELLLRKLTDSDLKRVDELLEQAVAQAARAIVDRGSPPQKTFDELVALYSRQPKLGTRTSTSIENQAYSTPAPLAYLASELAGIDSWKSVYEPSAGNGMLLIAANPASTRANELDPARHQALRRLGFDEATQGDAMSARPDKADVVIANPPFGVVKDDSGNSKRFKVGNLDTAEIDHAISLKALEAMKDAGSAVLIIGGVNKLNRTQEARSDAYNGAAKRKFFYHLYGQYNVVDHFTVAGELYERQGAGWPVDVIVIRGRGKSQRALPAVDVPPIYSDWNSLGNLLDKQDGARNDRLESDQRTDESRPRGDSVQSDAVDGQGRVSELAGRSDTADGESVGRSARGDAGVRGSPGRPGTVDNVGNPDAAGRGGQSARVEQPGSPRTPGSDRAAAKPEGRSGQRVDAGQATDQGRQAEPTQSPARLGRPADVSVGQAAYTPVSKSGAIGTLVPTNMQTAVSDALGALEDEVGQLDDFVAEQLGYDPARIGSHFSAEQIDALALALKQFADGKGFIIGDQTGIGKGRVVAGVIRWTLRQGMTPIFVTEKANLYADMFRDLTDIDQKDIRPLMTNAGETIALDDEGNQVLKTPESKKHNGELAKMAQALDLGDYNMIFTTYSQMQTLKGERTARMDFIEAFASNGILIMDESHNAGGNDSGRKKQGESSDATKKAGRAEFARRMVGAAKGVFYSSATYAKRPSVMDLYYKTDMVLAVENNASKLPDAISAGGVPLQQVVAAMLTKSGQYVRRERSFAGVEYSTPSITVDRKAAERISSTMLSIKSFDDIKAAAVKRLKEDMKARAAAVSEDGSVGGAGAESTNFTSIMHNLIDQMLLGLKADVAAQMAIDALKAAEKPVITVSNTMGSFIGEYADDVGLKPGDTIALTFKDLLLRYLKRSRDVTVKEADGSKSRRQLTDSELGGLGVRLYESIQESIRGAGELDQVPISPIDWIHGRIRAAGYTSDEITGRNQIIEYGKGTARGVYRMRPSSATSPNGRRKVIAAFNSGKIDVVILNQAGSTGLSLHASEKFKNQNRRHMVIAQAEKNIDTHMQMLGRVHRTGQIIAPRYSQTVADIPAEKRPAAVLAKKMASLNANTTASRSSQFTSKESIDFLNEYGDRAVASLMADLDDVHRKLGEPLNRAESGDGYAIEDAARKVTGRIPMLPVKDQEELYDMIETAYREEVARADALGENSLEAKTLELVARTVSRMRLFEGKGTSPFAQPAYAEIVDVKRLGKPYTSAQVREQVAEHVGGSKTASLAELYRAGQSKQSDAIRSTLAEFGAYRTNFEKSLYESGVEDRVQVGKLGMLDGQADTWRNTMRAIVPGGGYRLILPDGSILAGIVTDVRRKKGVKLPVATGSWVVTFAIADGIRTLSMPLSRMVLSNTTAQEVDSTKARLLPSNTDRLGVPIERAFDEGQNQAREQRVMITGNLLAGFGKVKKGQITNYTTSDGRVQQGILMPRTFDMKDFAEQQPVLLTDSQVIAFLRKVNAGIVETSDGAVRIINRGNGYSIQTAKSKSEGGRYFLNKPLRDAVGDFVSVGGAMRANVEDRGLRAALKALRENLHQEILTTTYKDEAKSVGGKPTIELSQTEVMKQPPPKQGAEPEGDDGVSFHLTDDAAGEKRRSRHIAFQSKHSRDSLQSHVDAIAKRWSGVSGLKVKVIDNETELPARIVRPIMEKGVMGRVGGLMDSRDGIAYLLRENIDTMDRFENILFHEVEGHLSIRQFLGEDIVSFLNRVAMVDMRGVKKIGTQYGFYNKDGNPANGNHREARLRSADEYVARMAETVNSNSPPSIRKLWDYLVSHFAEWARKAGWKTLRPTAAEIRGWLRRAQRDLRSKNPRPVSNAKKAVEAMHEYMQAEDLSGVSESRDTRSEPPAPNIESENFAAEALAELGQVDDLFKNPATKARSLPQAVRDLAPDAKWGGPEDLIEHEHRAERRYLVTAKSGEPLWIYERGREAWIDVSRLNEGEGGDRIYQAVADYARNTGRRFIGDPEGLSRPAIIRRTYHMLSNIVRYGDLQGFDPAPEQLQGDPATGVAPLEWPADNVGRFRALIRSFHATTLNLIPEVRGFRFDFGRGAFVDAAGAVVDGGAFKRLYDDARSRKAPVGRRAIKAGIFLESLVREESRNHPLLLARVLRQPGQLVEDIGSPLFSINPDSWGAPVESRLDNLIYTLQDKHVDLERVQRAIKESSGALSDQVDAYLREELFHGRAAYRLQRFLTDEFRPFLQKLSLSGVSMDQLEQYLHARHAPERNAAIAKINPKMPDGGSGMTDKAAFEYMDSLPADRRRTLEQLARSVDAMTNKTRATLVGYGLESQKTVEAWADAYQHYVPLHREDMDFGPGTGQGFSVRGPSTKRALGSERKVVNIIANIAAQRERAIVRGEKNRVAAALYGLATLNPNDNFWKVDHIARTRYIDPRTGLVAEGVDPTYKSRDDVVSVRLPDDDGNVVEHTITFNQHDPRAARMAQSLKSIDVDDLNKVLSLSAQVTRYFASINTQYNPVFGAINLVRDAQAALLGLTSTHLDGEQGAVLKDTLSALRGIYIDARAVRRGEHPTSSWAQLWEEFQTVGGQTGYRDMFRTSSDRADAIQAELSQMSEGKSLSVFHAVRDWLSDFNLATENAVRLATYKAGKENQHLSNERAASIAKNITVNFNRKGQSTSQLGALYAFFNASAQGTARMLETLSGPKGKQIIAGGVLLGVAQSLMLAAAGFDDDEPPEFVKERNLILPLPGTEKKYLLVPYPLGFHILPNIGRIAAEYAVGGFREGGKRIGELASILVEAFNPLGGSGLSMQTITPTAIDPLAALAENKDWTGKPIAREDFSDLNPTPGHQRAKASASDASIAASRIINALTGGTDYVPGTLSPTPDQLDYLVGQVTGGIGRETRKAWDTAEFLTSGDLPPTYKVPLLGRFYGSSNDDSSYGNRFYDLVRRSNLHKAEIEGRARHGGDYRAYLEANPEAKLYRGILKAATEVSKVRRARQEMEKAGYSKSDLEEMDRIITARMKEAVDTAKEIRDQGS